MRVKSVERQATLSQSNLEHSELRVSELVSVLAIAGSGFFVDVYDIVIFSVVRIPSLVSLGVSHDQTLGAGIFLLNMQLVGMVIGGFLWGILGDKKGRKAALFGSIFLYSLATFLNGFVQSVPAYGMIRLLAGIGLAGEVGAAMTIAAEVTPAQQRGYGAAAIRGLGALGGLAACLVGDRLPWRTAYMTAGIAGFVLLLARMSIKESGLFLRLLQNKEAKLGSIKLFFDKGRLLRLLRCILAVVPFWFAFGILVSFAPEICNSSKNGGVSLTVAAVALYFSIGGIFGEVLSGTLSQILGSRKRALFIFFLAAMAMMAILLISPAKFYPILCLPLGFFIHYNVLVYLSTAEQFGTNLRSTATTLTPNFVRASAIPITILFSYLATIYGALNAAMIAGTVCFILAFISILPMEETFAKDLNFIES